MKARPNKLNALNGVIPKLSLYRPKDCQRSEVLKRVDIGNNGFKDPSFWESIEGGLCISKDRPCEFVESQEMTVGFEQVFINGLDLEISRGTARERPRMFAEPRDMEETDDTRRNPRGYNILLQFISLWYIRLGHLSLNLFKKTVKIISGISNLDVVKEEDFVCLTYN